MREIRLLNFISKNKTVLYRSALIILPITFLLLSAYVLFNPPQYLDIHISNEIQEHQAVNLNTMMIWISWLGRIPVSVSMVSLLSLFFVIIKKQHEALFILSSLLSGVIGLILKILINRPRPTDGSGYPFRRNEISEFPQRSCTVLHNVFWFSYDNLLDLEKYNFRDQVSFNCRLSFYEPYREFISVPIGLQMCWARLF